MTRPADSAEHPDEGALREVQGAYRALPPAEPSATLDARVRAAVAAELAGEGVADTTAPAATAKVIEFPWWRRASLPLAAAATLMLAVGLGRMWFVEGMSERAPDSPYQAPPAAVQEAAPAAASEAPAAPAAAEPREADTQPQLAKPGTAPKQDIADAPPAAKTTPRKSTAETADDAVIFRGLERAAPPPPAEAEAKRETAAQADSARRERSAESLNAAPAPAPAAVPAAKPAASEAPAAKATQKRAADSALPDDASTFDEVRRLLREQRHDDARALLKRWRDAHPNTALPEDLRTLAAELDHAP